MAAGQRQFSTPLAMGTEPFQVTARSSSIKRAIFMEPRPLAAT